MVKSRTGKVLILSSGHMLTTFVSLISAALLTRLLSKTDFASYRQAMLAYTFAAPFAILGLDRALYAFLPGQPDRARPLLIENLLLLGVMGAFLSLFIVLGGNQLLAQRFNNPALAPLVSLMVAYPLFMVPATATSACLMSRNRTSELVAFNVASRLVMFLLVALPCIFWPSPSTAIRGQVAGAVLTAMVAFYLMFRACPGPMPYPTRAGLRKQLFFSIPLGLSTIVGVASVNLDQVLVSLRCTPETFAVYTLGAMQIPLVGIITGSITSVVVVDYARYYNEGNSQAVVDLIHKAMIKSGVLILPAMAFLFAIAPELMRVLFGKAYEWSAIPFRIYLLQLPIRTITFGAILLAAGHSRSLLAGTFLGLAASALLGWVLIGLLGAAGAAWGSLLGAYLVTIPYLVIAIGRILDTRRWDLFPWLSLGKLIAISILPAIIILPLKTFVHIPDSAWIILAFAICLPLWLLGFNAGNIISLRNEVVALVGRLGFRG